MKYLVMMIVAGVALPLLASAANVAEVETFESSLNGWVAYDMVNQQNATSLAVDDGALKLSYPATGTPKIPEEHTVRADSGASAGIFVGDYITAGVNAFSFRIKPESDAAISVLLQNSDAHRRWSYDLNNLPQDEWSTVVVSVAPDTLAAVHSGGTTQQLIDDLQNVSWIGIMVKRSSSSDEHITWLDDMQLVGPGREFSEWMSQATSNSTWQAEMLPEADLDGDGMLNQSEFLAGTDGTDDTDVFSISLGDFDGTGLPLSWASTIGRNYRVFRASHPGGEYTTISEVIEGTPPTNSYKDLTASGEGPWFYKIEVKRSE